jgi:hypothetical protein
MNANQANSDFVAIKGKIVEKGVEVADGTRTAEYARKVDEVYEKGKQAQYDEFWDAYQPDTRLEPYQYSSKSWNDDNFYPERDMIGTSNIYGAFYGIGVTDFAKRLKDCDVKLDTSKSTMMGVLFAYAYNITTIPKISAISAPQLSNDFTECFKLKTIECLEVHENLIYANTVFGKCYELENLTIEGTIGQNGLNLQWSTKLSKASWISIINAISATATGKSITGSLESVQRAFETSAGAMDGDASAEWLNLIASKSNWTINLV